MERVYENVRPLRLELRIPAGRIAVETADGDRAELRLEPLTDSARDVMGDVAVDLRRHGGGHQLVVDVPERRGLSSIFGGGPEFDLWVRCPLGSSLDARTASADVEARGTFGEVSVKTASGDVDVESVEGDASVQTASGDVSVERVAGAAELSTASGDVEIGRAERVRANLVSGDFSAREVGGNLRVNSVSGDQEIDAVGEGSVELQSVSGDIRLGVRRGTNVWMDVRSLSGDMSSDLTPTDGPPADDAKLVELRIKSVSGDVRLEQAPAASAADV